MIEDGPIAALRRLASMTEEQMTALTGVRAVDAQNKRSLQRSFEPFGLRYEGKTVVRPQEGETPSLFLFSGDLASFNARDLTPLALCLDEARAGLAAAEAEEGFARRATFKVIPPPQSSATDAALQGYTLARQVRAVLGEPTAPLTDLATWAEEKLCVCVRAAQFATGALRAAAVRDEHMGAAGILVNTSVADPRLLRVAIAHELCHLMFDPSGARVALTLDELPTGSTSERVENRARAFAAELLVPRAGLRQLLGPPAEVTEEDQAAALVEQARRHFDVSRDLATWHLGNHRYLSRDARDALRASQSGTSGARGTAPLQEVRPTAENVRRAVRSRSMARARIAAIERSEEQAAHALLSAKLEDARARPLDIAVELARRFDDALENGQHAQGLALLTQLDPRKMPGDTCSGFLGYVRAPCHALGGEWLEAYRSAAKRTVMALAEVWSWEPEDVADAATGLLG